MTLQEFEMSYVEFLKKITFVFVELPHYNRDSQNWPSESNRSSLGACKSLSIN